MATEVHKPQIILKRTQVQARTGISRSGIYQKMADGEFPKSISLGPRAVGWLESSIEAWIQGRIDLSLKTEG
jgi:prophage regulatory protein